MPSILLVDDEERFVKSLHTILKHYDYECTEALSGSEAIRLVQTRHFDLALLDVTLPDMSGCDVLDFIKTSHKNTAAIMLTGISSCPRLTSRADCMRRYRKSRKPARGRQRLSPTWSSLPGVARHCQLLKISTV